MSVQIGLSLLVALAACLGGCGGGSDSTAAPTTPPRVESQKNLTLAAVNVFVNGVGTSAEGTGKSWLSNVSTIDRFLRVHYKIPANTGFPGAMPAGPAANGSNLTIAGCNRTYTCPAIDFYQCPGMKLNTAYTRTFGETPSTPYERFGESNSVPEFSWTPTSSKFYTLLFVDFFQKVPGFEGAHFFHGAWYNIEGNNVSTATSTGISTPACPFIGAGNVYTFMLFQHDAKLSAATITNSDALSKTATAYNFTAHLAATTLTEQNLVSLNWAHVEASPVSNVVLAAIGQAGFVQSGNCDQWTNADMCAGIDVVNTTSATKNCKIHEPDAMESSWMAF